MFADVNYLMKLALSFLLAVLILFGGVWLIDAQLDHRSKNAELVEVLSHPRDTVERYEDDEAGVVCWVSNSNVSCLPRGWTQLDIKPKSIQPVTQQESALLP